MSSTFISTIIGLVLAVFTLGQVAPSVTQAFASKNVEVVLSHEESLSQQIQQYRTLEGSYPSTMADLISKGYWRTSDNDNGFGGNYTFSVDSTKGLVKISTTIADAAKRALYLGNFRHTFKPSDMGSGVVATTFVMPSTGSLGAPLPASNIAVASAAPSASSNTYWYDTSSGSAILKVSNGASWADTSTVSTTSIAAPSGWNTLSSASSLPSTASVGDVRYVYDSGSGQLMTYVYANGNWAVSDSGNFANLAQYTGYRAWSNGAFAASCKEYKNSRNGYSYTGATGNGLYRIDADGSGPLPPVTVWCDMTSTPTTGYTELTLSAGSPVNAREAESMCGIYGLQLFVPRTNEHFAAARSKFGVSYFSIMGIYPIIKGAICKGSSFNSVGCSGWAPRNGSIWFVQSGIEITEPNGDNDTDGSMIYTYDASGNISWYNDIANLTTGGQKASTFACSALAE